MGCVVAKLGARVMCELNIKVLNTGKYLKEPKITHPTVENEIFDQSFMRVNFIIRSVVSAINKFSVA